VSSSKVPVAQRRPFWLTCTATVVNVRPALSSSTSNWSGWLVSAARRKTMWADTARRPGA
jgi:hypothetical protein